MLLLQVGNNQVWGGALHLPARSPPEQSYSAPPAFVSMGQMENMMPPPPPDSSKAPGYRSASQRMVNSPIGMILLFDQCFLTHLTPNTLIFFFFRPHCQHWLAMPPVSLAALCIYTVILLLERPRSADSTFPLTHGVHPHQVLVSLNSPRLPDRTAGELPVEEAYHKCWSLVKQMETKLYFIAHYIGWEEYCKSKMDLKCPSLRQIEVVPFIDFSYNIFLPTRWISCPTPIYGVILSPLHLSSGPSSPA